MAAVLLEVTGHTYTVENNAWTRTLVATHHVPAEQADTGDDAERVLAPLVASWFDAAAHIAALSIDAQSDTDPHTGADDRRYPVGDDRQ